MEKKKERTKERRKEERARERESEREEVTEGERERLGLFLILLDLLWVLVPHADLLLWLLSRSQSRSELLIQPIEFSLSFVAE